jgi:hypothetical protein
MAYTAASPYYGTRVVDNKYLDVMKNRPIKGDSTDISWTVTPTYSLRPDLLAHDLYGDSRLWWVFAQRNPNTLKDPLFDFATGTTIYLPKLDNIKKGLGL